MTDDELEAVERDNARTHPAKSTVEHLVAEVRRLRALPVIATCGACRWCSDGDAPVCMHDRAHVELEIDGASFAPPAWCPLRGAR